MVSRVALLSLLALAASALGGIDFTPNSKNVDFEGVAVKHLAFRRGSEWVLYQPPGQWLAQGSGSQLRLTPQNASLADASIEARPLSGAAGLDEESITRLHTEMEHALPKEAEKVEWEPVEANPVLLNRHETRRLTVAYTAFAQRIKITVVVCNFAEEQILFRLSAREVDFDKLYDLFRRSLYSWQGMP